MARYTDLFSCGKMPAMKRKSEIKSNPEFSEQIGFYVSGMAEVREQLSNAVKDLSNEEISAKFTPTSHSIGQLVLHNAEAEWWWLKCVAAEKDLDKEEATREAFWDILLDEDFASRNYSAEFCINGANEVREKCFEVLKKFNDEDLEKLFSFSGQDGNTYEVSLRWILHHLIDHEAQHKGQILMLKRLIREEKH